MPSMGKGPREEPAPQPARVVPHIFRRPTQPRMLCVPKDGPASEYVQGFAVTAWGWECGCHSLKYFKVAPTQK